MLDDKNPEVNLKAASILLQKGLSVDSRKLEKIAASPVTRVGLYEVLKETGKTSLFPKKYATQRSFAESVLVQALSYEEDIPERVELLKRQEVMYEGKKGVVYLFKFKIQGDDTWFTGMSGLFSLNRKDLTADNRLTYSRFEILSSKSIELHINSYLQPMENDQLGALAD